MSVRHIALALAAATVLVAPVESALAKSGDRLIRRCEATGAGDISMHARYEVRSSRKRFDVEFEARASNSFKAGKRVSFKVDGVAVGSDRLESVVGGDVVGELNLSNRPREAGDDWKPFPSNFPSVSRGTQVKVLLGGNVVLGCKLN